MGRAADRAALFRLLGLGRERPVPVGQADGLLPRRGPQSDGGLVAAADQGQGRVARAVHPLHRPRADDPRGRGDPGARARGRDRAEADRGHQLRLHVQRRRRRGASHAAVLRELRLLRDVQGRLVGELQAVEDPVGRHEGDAEHVRSRRLRPGRAGVGALLPAGRLLAGQGHRGGAPGEARGDQGRLLGGRRAIQRPADARRIQRVVRHPAADGRPDEVPLPLRRAERRLGDDPKDLRALVLDQRRPRGARRGRSGRDRRGGRPPRRVRAVRRRRGAQAHLLDDGRRRLHTGGIASRCPPAR